MKLITSLVLLLLTPNSFFASTLECKLNVIDRNFEKSDLINPDNKSQYFSKLQTKAELTGRYICTLDYNQENKNWQSSISFSYKKAGDNSLMHCSNVSSSQPITDFKNIEVKCPEEGNPDKTFTFTSNDSIYYFNEKERIR